MNELENLKDIFREELSEILKKYLWDENTAEVRNSIASEIKDTLFNHKFSSRTTVVDKTTEDMKKKHKFLFMIKEGKKEYYFSEYIEKLYNSLND